MSDMSNHFNQIKARQSGVALITGLIFMVVMTIIVIAALRSATLEERMAANARNRQVALQAAEAVLREVELTEFKKDNYTKVFSDIGFTTALGCTQCLLPVAGDAPRWETMTEAQWLAAPKLSVDLDGVTDPPRYIIEILAIPSPITPSLCRNGIARITARGQGRDSGTVFLQSVYRFEVAPPCSS